MTPRTALALTLAAAGLACAPKRIPGTTIESTADTRAVHEVVQSYRVAMEKRDAAAVLALVSPRYFDTAGTTDPADDLDRGKLETSLAEDFQRTEGTRVELTLRKIEVTGDEAEAELFYDAYYRVQTPTGVVPKRDSDIHRMKLHRVDGAWKIVSGL